MMRQAPTERVSADELRLVCADLERRLSAGEACSAEFVFASHPALKDDADAALEVIYTEFVAREQLGQRPAAEDFFTRFPQWREGLEQLFQIHGTVGDNNTLVASKRSDAGQVAHWKQDSGQEPTLRRVGNYELLGEIGRGGMGVVYKARQVGLNRLVALKMILTGDDAGPGERARFRAEAEAAARLHHPNIVHIHEIGEHEGRPFLSLEYVDGGSVEDLLTGAPCPAVESARLVETLARAMHYAHEHGVIHRDLKPANVLLVSGGVVSGEWLGGQSAHHSPLTTHEPKITDFGLARRLRTESIGGQDRKELTTGGAILGTPAYMSPEQAAGDAGNIGPATDVYALGAMLYELLTGRPPFQGVGVLDTLEQVRTCEPLPPSRLLPGLVLAAHDLYTYMATLSQTMWENPLFVRR